jgi:zinc protease
MNRACHRVVALALVAACVTAPVGAQAASKAPAGMPTIKYERFTLPNGLVAIFNENHASPIVTIDIWYHVGSKNELPGRTGFAHLFEHMMFEGSQNIEAGQHRMIVQSSGGVMNGSTTEDRTNYYETLPSNQLETALWMESDRMATLLTRLDQARLDAER